MEYDFSGAFKRVENELIDGIMRNLSRHRAEEEAYGFTWEQWQALQLKELEAYRKATPAMFAGDFTEINDRISEVLHTAYNDAGTAEEAKLLKQIQAGKFTPKAEPIEGSFFGLNTGRLEHMVGATRADFARGEWSMLRQANDEYRRIIFDAQIYSATGATYEKAVDMATKDFLKNGIQCITYKNGSRHNIAEYARMAMKTGQKRAYLMGEGDVHDKYGIHTVRVNKRQDACPLCVGWLGKVLVDDVYAGGTAKEAAEANVPLLSEAMAQGFLHPNCKDVYTMYIEGVSRPAEPWTKEEIEQIAEEYNAEQAIRRAEDMHESYERMAKYSLDPINKERYQARADAWAARRDSIVPIPPKPTPEPQPAPEPKPTPEPEPTPNAFSDDEMEALEWYVSGDGQWINQYLRGRGDFGTLSENEEWLVEHLRAATNRPINDVDTLYRSVDARAIFGNLSSDELYDLQDYIMYGEGAVPKNKVAGIEKTLEKTKGRTITEKGFLSSTMDKEVAVYWEDFTGAENPIVLELDAKGKTIKGAKIPEALEVADDPQREVLLAPETRYKIKEISLETFEDAETGDRFKYINVKAEIVTDEAAETIAAEATEEAAKEVFDIDAVKWSTGGGRVYENMEHLGVEYREVKTLEKTLDNAQIVERLAGGDQTAGSCFSLAHAYIGNVHGLNVRDFRGGASRDIIAMSSAPLSRLNGIDAIIEQGRTIRPAKALLKKVEEGKEYMFVTGRHAAIVRRVEGELQYLELQDARYNGWHPFEYDEVAWAGSPLERTVHYSVSDTLKSRFGCANGVSAKYGESWIADVQNYKGSDELRALLGYINTAEHKQMKGASGYAR